MRSIRKLDLLDSEARRFRRLSPEGGAPELRHTLPCAGRGLEWELETPLYPLPAPP